MDAFVIAKIDETFFKKLIIWQSFIELTTWCNFAWIFGIRTSILCILECQIFWTTLNFKRQFWVGWRSFRCNQPCIYLLWYVFKLHDMWLSCAYYKFQLVKVLTFQRYLVKISSWTFHLGPIDKPYNYKLSIINFNFKSKYIVNIPHIKCVESQLLSIHTKTNICLSGRQKIYLGVAFLTLKGPHYI
jgi:hypothetical protein